MDIPVSEELLDDILDYLQTLVEPDSIQDGVFAIHTKLEDHEINIGKALIQQIDNLLVDLGKLPPKSASQAAQERARMGQLIPRLLEIADRVEKA